MNLIALEMPTEKIAVGMVQIYVRMKKKKKLKACCASLFQKQAVEESTLN